MTVPLTSNDSSLGIKPPSKNNTAGVRDWITVGPIDCGHLVNLSEFYMYVGTGLIRDRPDYNHNPPHWAGRLLNLLAKAVD